MQHGFVIRLYRQHSTKKKQSQLTYFLAFCLVNFNEYSASLVIIC